MQALAVLCSDLHLSHNPPVARSGEQSWYAAMERPLNEMKWLAHKLQVPIVCAGDLLDKPQQQPEFVNWAMDHVPFMFSISGQHDTVSHRLDQLHKSAYRTLDKAGTIEDIGHGSVEYEGLSYMRFFGFPWGVEIESPIRYQGFNLAVVHQFVWTDEVNRHAGAGEDKYLRSFAKKCESFDAVVIGDNHCSWISGKFINCGTFLRRKSDERQYKPMIGILYEDGTIKPHYLDCSQDKFLDDDVIVRQAESAMGDLSGFVNELRLLGMDALDFRQAIKHRMDQMDVDRKVRELVMEVMQ